jgi:osmotically-inducible protein OsmY
MDQSAALVILPTPGSTDRQVDHIQALVSFFRQSREDLHLTNSVECALRGTGYAPLRCIKVTVHVGLITLEGQVPSYHLKQLAQTTALAVPGAQQTCNKLEVRHPS